MGKEETVTIPKKEYDELLATKHHYEILEARGVDNWIGYREPYNLCLECFYLNSWDDDKCKECNEELDLY